MRHISFINTGKAEEVELSQFKPKPIPKLKMKSMSLKITNNTIKLKIKRKANQSKRLGDDYKKLVAKI
ncbi:MAG: hypothetical protein ACR2NY_01955 [Alphaproteobacteria bacterium]